MIEGGRIVFSDSMDAFNNYAQPKSILAIMDNPPPASDLQSIENVTKVEFLTDKQCRIYFTGSSDITQTIMAASMQQNWKLKEISLEKSLLDDVFKQLSGF